jgi:hypothetical protein
MENEAHLRKNPRGSSPHVDGEPAITSQVRRRPSKAGSKNGVAAIGQAGIPAATRKDTGKG